MRWWHGVILGVLLNPVAAEGDEPNEFVATAAAMLQENRVEEAAALLTKHLPQFPKVSRAWSLRAEAHARLGKYAEGLADADEALRLTPGDADAREARALVLFHAGRYEESIAEAERLIELRDVGMGRYLRAVCNVRLQRYEPALIDIEIVMKQLPDDPAAWDLRGEIYLAQGKPEKAVEDLTHAIRRLPTNTQYREHRGQAYDVLKDYRKAVADYTVAIEGDRKNSAHWNRRAVAYSYLNEWEYMRRDAAAAVGLNDQDAVFWFNLGLADVQLGHTDDAAREFDRAIELAPDLAQARFQRGQLRADRNDWKGVLEDCERATAADPNYADAWNQTAVAYIRLGDFAAAERAATRAVESAPQSALFIRNRGTVRAELGEWSKACADYRACVQLESASVFDWFEASLAAAYHGEDEEFQSLRRDAWNKFGEAEDPELLRRLGELLSLQSGMEAELQTLVKRVRSLSEAEASAADAFRDGLAAYRTSDYESAAACAASADRQESPIERAKARMLAALIDRRLSRASQAADDVKQAQALAAEFKRLPPPATGVRTTWQAVCEFELLERETAAAAPSPNER